MKLFFRTVETGTISAAGRALGLSTTAASKTIQDLEAALGVRLLNRTTRHVSPSEAGRHLYARLAPLLGEVETALRQAGELHDQPRGVLRVVARRSFGALHVVPALAGFRGLFPAVSIDLTLTEETELTPTNGVDLVVRLGLPPGKSFVAHELASPTRILCASPDYLAGRPAPKQPADLGAHDCLCYRRDYEPVIWVFEDEHGREDIEVAGSLRANSGDVLRHAALDGLGMVLLPEWMVGQDVAAGRLVRCLDRLRAYPAGYQASIYAAHARADFVPAKITAFVTHLRTRLGQAGQGLS